MNSEVLIKFKGDTSDIDKKTDSVKDSIGSKLGNVAKGIAGAFVKGTAIAGGAITAMIGKSVSEYGKLEQSIGGVETLFGDSAETVIKNAEKAYKTAGVDANKYMEQVTSFSASLLQSTGGDTVKAAETADMAIIDMADNANKFGTSMEMIQSAYQGFAKQNYTMLDNLKLGYGGTKTEMERLLSDAEKISGIHYDISNLDDVYNAIHVIQGELGVTGTTATEASTTIQGSMASMKSAFTNFLSGAGGIDEVISTVITFADNVVNAIVKMAPKLINGLVTLVNKLIPKIPKIIKKLLPIIVDGAVKLVQGVVNALPELLSVLAQMLPTIITSLINGVIDIINSIAEQLPTILPILVNALLDGILAILDNVDRMIDAGIQLVLGLINGIVQAVPIILVKSPIIIIKIIEALLSYLPQLLTMGPQIIMTIITGLIESIPKLVEMAPEIINGIVKGITSAFGTLKNICTSIIGFIKNVFSGSWKKAWEGVKNIMSNIFKGIANIFKAPINVIISGLNAFIKGLNHIKIPKWVPGVGGKGINIPLIPKLATGTNYVPDDMLAMIHEGEAVVPKKFNPYANGIDSTRISSMQNTYNPNIQVYNNVNIEQDPLGQLVHNIKTYSGGSPNDYNYGVGVS